MSVKLNMVFTRGTTTKTISIANPRTDIAGTEVKALMQEMLDKEMFKYEAAKPQLDGIKRAYIRKSVITELPEA